MTARSIVLDAGGVIVDVVVGEPHLDLYPPGAASVPYDAALETQGVWIGWRRQGGAFADPSMPAFDLRAYAKARRDFLIFNSPLAVGPYEMVTDARTQDYVSKACNVAARNPAFVVEDWSLPDGTWASIDATTMLGIGDKITSYVNGLFTVYRKTVLAGIDAGTVTDPAGVDAAFEAGIDAAGIA